jgi:hypothetical protein
MNSIVRTIADTPVLTHADAHQLADQIVDQLIDDLRRDPAMPPLSYLEWQLIFDRSRTRIAEQIHARTHDRADLDEVIAAVEATLDSTMWKAGRRLPAIP